MSIVHKAVFIIDANVLIDYAKTDASILTLTAKHLGQVQILEPIVKEVKQLEKIDYARLGLTVVETTIEQLLAAGVQRGYLSFIDHLCLIVAHQVGVTCVTNDRVLHRACSSDGVSTLFGLELMVGLVKIRQLLSLDAIGIAKAIHKMNPHHISAPILIRFQQQLQEIE